MSMNALKQEALSEIPRQFESYMKIMKIEPDAEEDDEPQPEAKGDNTCESKNVVDGLLDMQASS